MFVLASIVLTNIILYDRHLTLRYNSNFPTSAKEGNENHSPAMTVHDSVRKLNAKITQIVTHCIPFLHFCVAPEKTFQLRKIVEYAKTVMLTKLENIIKHQK